MATITSYKKTAKDCVVQGPNPTGKVQRLPFGHDAKKDAQRSDYRDKMTFDEVILNDEEMAKYAVKNSKRYGFTKTNRAQAFVGRCVQMSLNHCGLMVVKGTPEIIIQKKMDEAKIQIESRIEDPWGRSFYKDENSWRNGIYIFKNGELAFFIGVPVAEVPSQFALDRTIKLTVVTNAPLHSKGFR